MHNSKSVTTSFTCTVSISYNYYFCFGTFPGQSFHIASNYYSDVDGDVHDNDVYFFQAIVNVFMVLVPYSVEKTCKCWMRG